MHVPHSRCNINNATGDFRTNHLSGSSLHTEQIIFQVEIDQFIYSFRSHIQNTFHAVRPALFTRTQGTPISSETWLTNLAPAPSLRISTQYIAQRCAVVLWISAQSSSALWVAEKGKSNIVSFLCQFSAIPRPIPLAGSCYNCNFVHELSQLLCLIYLRLDYSHEHNCCCSRCFQLNSGGKLYGAVRFPQWRYSHLRRADWR